MASQTRLHVLASVLVLSTARAAAPLILVTSNLMDSPGTNKVMAEQLQAIRAATGRALDKAVWLRDARSGSGDLDWCDHGVCTTYQWADTRRVLYMTLDLPNIKVPSIHPPIRPRAFLHPSTRIPARNPRGTRAQALPPSSC